MQSVLNEDSILSVLGDLIKGAKNSAKYKDAKKSYIKGSISRYTKNLIMTFPTFCDDTISPNTAMLISKANERNVVTMLQLLFSSMSVKGDNTADIIAKFHKNIDNLGMDEIMDIIDKKVGNLRESGIEVAYQRDAIQEMVIALKEGSIFKTFDSESLNEKSLNDYLVKETYGKTIVYEAPDNYNNPLPIGSDIPDPNVNYNDYEDYLRNQDEMRKRGDYYRKNDEYTDKKQYNDFQMKRQQKNDKYQRDRDDIEDAYRRDRDAKMDQQNKYRQGRETQQDFNNLYRNQIVPQDVKKANELQPSLMIINVNDVDSDGNVVNRFQSMIGVKSRLVTASALDIVERLVSKNKTAINFKNFIRATTGEIKFFQDFMFCIKQAKINAKNAVKKGEAAQMWNVLEKRATKNNSSKLLRAGNDASAITTLVMNQETVNYLKSQFKIDVEKPKQAIEFMNAYNFLGFVIADENNEVAKFLYDGNNDFETVAYSALSKEVADQNYKKLVNLINQAGR